MRVLVVEPERRPELREISSSLEEMDTIVGGHLLSSFPFDDSAILMRNGEGGYAGLPANRGLKDQDGHLCDIIFGTFLLCGVPDADDHFTSLTAEQIKRYEDLFHTPEMFWGMDGRIVCLPLEADYES